MFWLIKGKTYQPGKGWLKFFIQLMIANVAICGYLYWQMGDLAQWLALSPVYRLTTLLAEVLITTIIYIAVLLILGLRYQHLKGQQS